MNMRTCCANDVLGRRGSVLMEGSAFSGAGGVHWNRYKYNPRNELIDAEQYAGSAVQTNFGSAPTDPASVNAGFNEYDYDPIGNRKQARAQQSPVLSTDYTTNALNQYSASTLMYTGTPPVTAANQFAYDLDGNIVSVQLSGDANCDGYVTNGDQGAYVMALTNPAQYQQTFPNCPLSNSDTNGNGVVNSGDTGHFVNFISNGNSGQTATIYTCDAENRLVMAAPMYLSNGVRRSRYSYDFRGRRVRAWTETHTCGSPCTGGTWAQATNDTDIRYVWDDWLLLEEMDGRNSNAVLRKYAWGLDLAGMNGAPNDRTSAGGIGGLLAMEVGGATPPQYWYCYDANGNVSQVLATGVTNAGAVKNHYEYDSYGHRVNAPGGAEIDQPYRFSTKAWDGLTVRCKTLLTATAS